MLFIIRGVAYLQQSPNVMESYCLMRGHCSVTGLRVKPISGVWGFEITYTTVPYKSSTVPIETDEASLMQPRYGVDKPGYRRGFHVADVAIPC